jgi:hypothetical protein
VGAHRHALTSSLEARTGLRLCFMLYALGPLASARTFRRVGCKRTLNKNLKDTYMIIWDGKGRNIKSAQGSSSARIAWRTQRMITCACRAASHSISFLYFPRVRLANMCAAAPAKRNSRRSSSPGLASRFLERRSRGPARSATTVTQVPNRPVSVAAH